MQNYAKDGARDRQWKCDSDQVSVNKVFRAIRRLFAVVGDYGCN